VITRQIPQDQEDSSYWHITARMVSPEDSLCKQVAALEGVRVIDVLPTIGKEVINQSPTLVYKYCTQ